MTNDNGVIVIDLAVDTSMTMEEMRAWDYSKLVVKSSGLTVDELEQKLIDFEIPSEIEDGDYKDYAIESAHHLSSFIDNIEGASVVGFSEGPRYWFVDYEYQGERRMIGPGKE